METFAKRLAWAIDYRLEIARRRGERRPSGRPVSQTYLEELAGLNKGHMSTLRKGKRPNPSLDTVNKLASVLGCSVRWLMTGEGDPHEHGEPPVFQPTQYIEREQRYPNRAKAIQLNELRWPYAVVRQLESIALRSDEDLSVEQWVRRGNELMAELKGKTAAPRVDTSSGTRPTAGATIERLRKKRQQQER